MLPTLYDAGRWSARGVRVTLLDSSPFLYYSGMVPEFLGGVYDRDEVRINLRRLCDRAGVRFIESRAQQLDPERRVVTTADGDPLSYDVAAVDIGAQNPGSLPRAIRTKPLYHIEALEDRIRATLDQSRRRLRLVVAGGGAAGVEIALNVTGRFAHHNRSDALDLTIVEGSERLLPNFPSSMGNYVAGLLETRGAQLETGSLVEAVHEDAAVLDDQRTLPADRVLWSTGSVGPDLFEDAGLVCDEKGFARVAPTLQCMGFPRLFAAGDCATVAGHEALRKVGVHAVKQGPVLRANLELALSALTAGQAPHAWPLDTFEPYWMAPLIFSTGAPEGLWTAGPFWLRSRSVLRLKHVIDRRWIRRYNPAWDDAGPLQLADATAATM
jgi:selenide,water dikinase